MDAFLESDAEEDIEENIVNNEEIEEGIESFDELSSSNDEKEEEEEEEEAAAAAEPTYNFTLDDIDWNKVSADLGQNVEIIESSDKNTPPLLLKKLRPVCNKNLLNKKLNDLRSKTSSLPWFELLSLSTQNKENKNENINPKQLKNNDIKREIFFYQNTLSSVKVAINRIKSEIENGDKIIERPNDFYAEMIKTDDHMKKIKNRILWEKKKIGIIENRKKNKRLRKYHKEMMSNKIQENYKKQNFEKQAIESYKNKTNDRTLQEILSDSRKPYLNKMKSKKKIKPNMKRIMKNLKYGSGLNAKGLKGKNKNRNTYSSTNNYFKDWKKSATNARRDSKFIGRGTKQFNSNKKFQRQNKKGNFKHYNKNVKRERGILGKQKKRGPARRPGKDTRRKMNYNNRNRK